MKPAEDADFYRIAPPPGASRESTLRLDSEGTFWHDGERVVTPRLARALHRWIARHPDDGRFILSNGYDWTYFEVEDAPFVVTALRLLPDRNVLVLSDESEEPLAPETLRVGRGGALYVKVKSGEFEARFSRHAQTSLAPALREASDGTPCLVIDGRELRLE